MKKIMQPEDVVIPQVESEIINHILDSQKKFISFLESKVKNREVAEDIFQTSVLKVLKKSKDLKDEEALIPWFYQILRNSVDDQLGVFVPLREFKNPYLAYRKFV